jgi:hypothetical protein
MKLFNFVGLLALLVGSVPTLAAGMSLDEARQRAGDFLTQKPLGLSRDVLNQMQLELRTSSNVTSPDRKRWEVLTGQQMLFFSDATGEVILYSNGELYSKSSERDRESNGKKKPLFYHDKAEFLAHARLVIHQLGWKTGPDDEMRRPPKPDKDGLVARSVVYVSFYERPNGISSRSGGNEITIGFDSWTGELVELDRRSGHVPAPMTVKISKDEALEIARKETELSGDSKVLGPDYVGLGGASMSLSGRGTEFAKTKILPLVYSVSGKSEWLYIAVDNGEILVRFGNAVAGSVAGRASSHERLANGEGWPNPDSYTGLKTAGTLVAILLAVWGAMYLWVRLSK